MKRFLNKMSIAIIFVLILFANISLAATDAELAAQIAKGILNSAQYVTIENDTTGTASTISKEIPSILITQKTIDSVVDSTTKTDSKNIDAKITDNGTIVVTIDNKVYEQVIVVSDSDGKAYANDQYYNSTKYNNPEYEMAATVAGSIRPADMENAYTGTVSADDQLYCITLAGGHLTNAMAKDNGAPPISFKQKDVQTGIHLVNPSDVTKNSVNISNTSSSVKVKVSSDSKAYVKGNEPPTDKKLNVDTPPDVGGKTTVDITEENANEKEIILNVTEPGTYALVLRDASGRFIEGAEYILLDANHEDSINGQTVAGNVKIISVEAGTYYLKIPEGASYTLSLEKIDNVVNNDPSDLQNIAEDYGVVNDIEMPETEFYEIVLSWFIIKMGEGLNKLIGLIAGETLSIDALVFDKYSRTTLTFFENDLVHYNWKSNELLAGSQASLNTVFNLFRNIAILSYMIILVYMGIRVLFMATADKKARYKEILFDWVKGIVIIYFFPYVMRYAILLNHGFVTYLSDNTAGIFDGKSATIETATGSMATTGDTTIVSGSSNYMNDMYKKACDTKLLSYSICWFVMLIQVVQFLIVYMKRLITIMFLIAIFPLVAISYAIDKIGDGKSQAFGHWCKEFILQVFVQTFHAVNYVLIMGIIFKIPQPSSAVTGGNVFTTNWFLIIIGITYVAKGGDILRGLFAQMSGGAGKDGGPLSVAKALIKTKVAIGAVKGLGKVASATFGANSLLGKGRGLIVDAHDTRLVRKLGRTEMQTHDTLAQNGLMRTLNTQGLNVMPELTDDEIRNNFANLANGSLNGESLVNAVNGLANTSQDRLTQVANQMMASNSLNQNQLREIEDILGHAVALDVVTNRSNRKGMSNVQINQSVEVVLRDRSNHDTNNRGSNLDKYIEATKDRVSERQLRNLSAEHSITVDEEKVRARRARGAEPPPANRREEVSRAFVAIKNAKNGEYDYQELHHHLNVVKEARDDNSLRDLVENESQDMNFTIEEFEANLHVQNINNSNRASMYGNEDERELLNESIRYVKAAVENNEHENIMRNLNANVEGLEEGNLPDLIDREKQERSRLEKKIQEEIDSIGNPYQIDKGQEYYDYLKSKDEELTQQFREKLVKSAVDTVLGAGTSSFKVGLGTATAGLFTGVSMDGKDNTVNELLTVVPSAYTMANDVSNKLGSIVSKPAQMVSNAAKDKTRVSIKTDRESIDINRRHYESEAKKRALNNELSEAEAKRNRLLEKLNKRIDNENGNNN